MTERYPEALWIGGGQSGGYYTGGPMKGVLHTTETASLPGYNNGYSAPHLTYSPQSRTFYQHTPLNYAARALRNTIGGPQTNRDSVIQLEIICYSQRSIALQYNRLWVGDLTPEHLDDIRAFMWWASHEFGILWKYPDHDRRMGPEEWDNYDGWCGHKHVPENTHWDPGALDYRALMSPGEEEEMIAKGYNGPAVVKIQQALLDAGYELPQYGADGDYGDETENAVINFQVTEGLPQTGSVGGVTAAFLIPGPRGPRGRRGLDGLQGIMGQQGPPGETPDLSNYKLSPVD